MTSFCTLSVTLRDRDDTSKIVSRLSSDLANVSWNSCDDSELCEAKDIDVFVLWRQLINFNCSFLPIFLCLALFSSQLLCLHPITNSNVVIIIVPAIILYLSLFSFFQVHLHVRYGICFQMRFEFLLPALKVPRDFL